jgi:molecular chaperone DnaK (HSP70)
MSEPSATIFGIDLGTTYSCIAHMDEYGRPVAIINAVGHRITPSVVFFDGENRIVGDEAKNNAQLHPDQVVEMVKRQMGHSDWAFFYNGVEYGPEEISSYILRKVVGDAEQALGCKIKDVVITCPAYFGINEREATARAGEIAGLNVRSIVNEPTAAAISYGLHSEQDQVVLVYDLGGGTFDITMIEIKSGEINVIAVGGNRWLGGRNWDEVIVNYLADQLKTIAGSTDDPLEDPETTQDLFLRAEQGKISLSAPARDKTDIAVTHAGQREKITLTRDKFNELTANLLDRTIEYTRLMLEEAGKKGYKHFDQILLVGGATRMLQVSERLKAEFGLEPKIYEPDEAVAKGAAWYAQKLAIGDAIKIKIEGWGRDAGQADAATIRRAQQEVADEMGLSLPAVKRSSEMKIRNVTSHSFGVVALKKSGEEIVSNIILKNTTVPAQAEQTFGTVEANQQNAEIRIMENIKSEHDVDPSVCEEIGNALFSLPPGLPANAPIEISFQLNEQGRLHAVARELSANKIVEVDIQTSRIISEEKLEEAKARSHQLVVS